MNKRIGLYGGAFNPMTVGHLHVIETTLREGNVDEVWVIPSYNHVFKNTMADYCNRVDMCKESINNKFNDFDPTKVHIKEIDKIICSKFKSYDSSTIAMMDYLHANYDHEFYIMIGDDNALSIDNWTQGPKLKVREKFIIISRDSTNYSDDWYTKAPHQYINAPKCGVSSTMVRTHVKERGDTTERDTVRWEMKLTDMVTYNVSKYIIEHDLYK